MLMKKRLQCVEEFRESCLQWRYHMSGRGTYIKDYERHAAIENFAVKIADDTLREIDELKKTDMEHLRRLGKWQIRSSRQLLGLR